MRRLNRTVFLWAAVFGLVAALTPAAFAIVGSGGSMVETNGYRIHSFTSNGTFDVTRTGTVEVLVVAGGGGGGYDVGGGGGAGGLVYQAAYVFDQPGSYAVQVGAGGLGSTATGIVGQAGGDSSIGTLTAVGGGGGGSYSTYFGGNGGNGGSGGGGSGQSKPGTPGSGTPGQGYDGGPAGTAATALTGAGGGGAGGAGAAGIQSAYGSTLGGTGLWYDVSGVEKLYAMGGKGSGHGWSGMKAGAANTGTGGDGGGNPNAGKNGGSGIVILRYGGYPSVTNAGAVVDSETQVTLNGMLVSTGWDGMVSASVYWGPEDAGAAEGGWMYTNALPGVAEEGALSIAVSPLLPGVKHYYRYAVSNAFGEGFAPQAGMFVSMGPAPGVTTGGGATNNYGAFALLTGEVLGGNPVPQAWICWGLKDEGTNRDAWERVIPLGAVSNWTFSAWATNLVFNKTYFYACYASNTYGDAWSPAATFSTRWWVGSTQDNWISANAPLAVQGSSGTAVSMMVRGQNSALNGAKAWLKFDLAGQEPDVKAGATVVVKILTGMAQYRSMPLRLYTLKPGFVPEEQKLGTSWTENAITWSNAPGNDVTSARANDPALCTLAGSLYDYSGVVGAPFAFALDRLGDHLQADGTMTVMLVQNGQENGSTFATREHTTALYRPVLIYNRLTARGTVICIR